MNKRIDVIRIICLLMWGMAIFAYFFQFPLKSISALIIPCLAVYLVCKIPKLQFDKKTIVLIIAFLVCLTCSAAFALARNTEITRVLRFLFILLAIVFCSLVQEDNFSREREIFISLAVAKSIVIIAIAITLLIVRDFSFLRQWAWTNDLGDIYFLNPLAPKVQVQGNALLVIAFFSECMKKNKSILRLGIMLAGIFFAGNFAYVLGLGLFIVYIA